MTKLKLPNEWNSEKIHIKTKKFLNWASSITDAKRIKRNKSDAFLKHFQLHTHRCFLRRKEKEFNQLLCWENRIEKVQERRRGHQLIVIHCCNIWVEEGGRQFEKKKKKEDHKNVEIGIHLIPRKSTLQVFNLQMSAVNRHRNFRTNLNSIP